jgi:hypothetical protein
MKNIFAPVFALGSLIGFCAGLSNSPLIATIVTGGFGVVCAWLQFRPNANSGNDKMDVKLLGSMLPFALGAIIWMILGIVIRTNDLLTFKYPSLRDRWSAAGFSTDQVNRMFDSLSLHPSDTATFMKPNVGSVLLGNKEQEDAAATMSKNKMDDADYLGQLEKIGYDKLIKAMREVGMNDVAIAKAIRTWKTHNP